MLKELIISECNTTHLIKNAKQTIEWRRNKILELSNKGRNQSDINRNSAARSRNTGLVHKMLTHSF